MSSRAHLFAVYLLVCNCSRLPPFGIFLLHVLLSLSVAVAVPACVFVVLFMSISVSVPGCACSRVLVPCMHAQ